MWDAQPIGMHGRDIRHFVARWTGAGTSVPTAVANVRDAQSTQATISRSGVGTVNVQVLDVPLGVVAACDFWVNSTAAGNNKVVKFVTPAAGSYLFQLQIAFGNGTATDISTSEELCADIWFAAASP